MIHCNNKTQFPFAIVREGKHGSSMYLANSFEDVLKIGWYIFSNDLSNDMYYGRIDEKMPTIDLLNQNKAAVLPWEFAPYSRLSMYEFIKETKEAIECGQKVEVLEEHTFKHRPDLREQMENVDYWMKKAVTVINHECDSEYMNVSQEYFQKF